ncbi:hypothetical protein EDD86DRAFT_245655 [Gorgonomyces haynaldii]|nr:hypothetical protein EDD86DRAFT_245655 [Gorgonomyces haynaldii]
MKSLFVKVLQDQDLFDQFIGFNRHHIRIRNRLLFYQTVRDLETQVMVDIPPATDRFLGRPVLKTRCHYLDEIEEIFRVYLAHNAALDMGLKNHPLTLSLGQQLRYRQLDLFTWTDLVDHVVQSLYESAFPDFVEQYDLHIVQHRPSDDDLYSTIDPDELEEQRLPSLITSDSDRTIGKLKFDIETHSWFVTAGLEDMQDMIPI